jgi:hypothetical protein
VEGVADVPQDSSTVLEMLKASRLRAQELREQIVARYEQLVIDREVRSSERLLSKGGGSLAGRARVTTVWVTIRAAPLPEPGMVAGKIKGCSRTLGHRDGLLLQE